MANRYMKFKKLLLLIVYAFLIIAGLYLVGLATITAISKDEIVECNKLVRYSGEFGDKFWITRNEAEMCNAHGIALDGVEVR